MSTSAGLHGVDPERPTPGHLSTRISSSRPTANFQLSSLVDVAPANSNKPPNPAGVTVGASLAAWEYYNLLVAPPYCPLSASGPVLNLSELPATPEFAETAAVDD